MPEVVEAVRECAGGGDLVPAHGGHDAADVGFLVAAPVGVDEPELRVVSGRDRLVPERGDGFLALMALASMKPLLALYMGGMGSEDTNFHAEVYRRMGYGEVVDDATIRVICIVGQENGVLDYASGLATILVGSSHGTKASHLREVENGHGPDIRRGWAGLGAFAVGIYGSSERRSAKRTGMKVPATVVSEKKTLSRGGHSYFATVRFKAPDGDWVEQSSRWGSNKSRLEQPIEAWYRPGKPIWLDDFSGSSTWVAGAAGLVFVAVGIALASGHMHG